MYDAFRAHHQDELAAVADLTVGLPSGCRCTYDSAQSLSLNGTSILVGVTLSPWHRGVLQYKKELLLGRKIPFHEHSNQIFDLACCRDYLRN